MSMCSPTIANDVADVVVDAVADDVADAMAGTGSESVGRARMGSLRRCELGLLVAFFWPRDGSAGAASGWSLFCGCVTADSGCENWCAIIFRLAETADWSSFRG